MGFSKITGNPLFPNDFKRNKCNFYMRLDLFKLHDPVLDDEPKKWIGGKGRKLEKTLDGVIKELLEKGWTKPELSRHLLKKFGISKPTADRLVYLRKEFYPLVFVKELLMLTGKLEKRFSVQNKIEFLKVSQPPLKIVKAPKFLTENLCKIAGAHAADGTIAENFFCISDGYQDNIEAFESWIEKEFGLNCNFHKISENEWAIKFHNKIFTRYLKQLFGFCDGSKVYSVREPKIIRNSDVKLRKAFALGALTFEAGIGMKNQIEFCVSSKDFQKDICEILDRVGIKFHQMEKQSGKYWRFWSNGLTKEETLKWMELFEPNTEKWLKLYEAANGYQGKPKSIEEATRIPDRVYPSKPNSKVSLRKVLLAIKQLKKAHRYKIVEYLVEKGKFESFGGKWAHGLKHYLDILREANIISVETGRFGKKKSFGTIVRQVYVFNPRVSEWLVPLRSQPVASDAAKSQAVCSLSSKA